MLPEALAVMMLVQPEGPEHRFLVDRLTGCGFELKPVGHLAEAAAQWTAAPQEWLAVCPAPRSGSKAPEPPEPWIDLLPEAVARVDQLGRLVWRNRAMGRLLQPPPNTTPDTAFFAMMPGLPARHRGGVPGADRRVEVQWRRGDGWFRVAATPIAPAGSGILVTAWDVTAEHNLSERVDQASAAAQAAEHRIELLESESRLAQGLNTAGTPPAPESDTILRLSQPRTFARLVEFYGHILALRAEQAALAPGPGLRQSLQALAAELFRLRAGPRDLVEIHGEAIRHCYSGELAARARALAEEARLLLLELMGHLLASYRAAAVKAEPPISPDHDSPPQEGLS